MQMKESEQEDTIEDLMEEIEDLKADTIQPETLSKMEEGWKEEKVKYNCFLLNII